jgi:hypothetical protein
MIKVATIPDIRPIIEMAQNFRDISAFVDVDVDICVNTYTDFINRGAGGLLFDETWGKINGAIAFVKAPDLHYPRMIAVETFWYVDPECAGVGLSLWRAFERWAKENKCDQVAMIHMMDSTPESLEKWYTRRGYTLAEKHYTKAVA